MAGTTAQHRAVIDTLDAALHEDARIGGGNPELEWGIVYSSDNMPMRAEWNLARGSYFR